MQFQGITRGCNAVDHQGVTTRRYRRTCPDSTLQTKLAKVSVSNNAGVCDRKTAVSTPSPFPPSLPRRRLRPIYVTAPRWMNMWMQLQGCMHEGAIGAESYICRVISLCKG